MALLLITLYGMLPNVTELLKGTGNLIRHIPVDTAKDYRNKKVKELIKAAADFAIKDMDKPTKAIGMTISKIKTK